MYGNIFSWFMENRWEYPHISHSWILKDFSCVHSTAYDERNKLYMDGGWYSVLLDWRSGSTSSKIHPGYIFCPLEVNWEVNSECSWISQMMELLYTLQSSLITYFFHGWFHLWLGSKCASSHLLSCFKLLGLLDA